MAERRPPPDIEALLVAFLKADEGMAEVVGTKVSTDLPKTFVAEKRVQLFRNGGGPVDGRSEAIDRPRVQINSFGTTKKEAFGVAAQAILSMYRAAETTFSGATISDVSRLTGPEWSPDPGTDIPRWITSFAVVARSR